MTMFGMTCCFTAPLTEVFDFFQRQIVACEVQERINQHAAMPRAEDEAVTIVPVRVLRIVAQMTLPEGVGHRCCSHWQTRMPTVGFLHSIYRERANGVDGERL